MLPDLTRLTSALADRYRIERELGAGGMATVYLAQDLRHDRRVAVKVLRPELAAVIGAERFLAEIKTTANLQHPHILPLFDSGAADSFLFYVMPFIDGETLRDRMSREKQLPIAGAVRIAREVASALDYAHRHGVIHRDIKPENILLHDGSALVADFGIALAASKAGGTRMTETGMSLGTPQYMSPEQAMGERDLDARTDVYGLGCVLYEMLAGEPPFTGPTAQAIVAKVMTEKPVSILTRRDTVPPGVEHAVSVALQKIPADRWGTAAAFSEALGGSASAAVIAPPTSSSSRRHGSGRNSLGSSLPWAVAFGLAAIAAIWGWTRHEAPAEPGVVRFTVQPATGTHLALPILGTATTVAISPDGRRVVYSGDGATGSQLYLQSVDDFRPHVLAGTADARFPEFSPDGKWIAFVSSDDVLKKMSVEGGTITTIAAAASAWGITWASNETLVYGLRNATGWRGLWRVPAAGGDPVQFSVVDTAGGERIQSTPRSAGDGRLVFYSSLIGALTDSRIGVVSLETGKATILKGLTGWWPLGLLNGQLLYVRTDGALMAAPFDVRTLQAGAPVQVADSIATAIGFAAAAISANGTLVYVHSGSIRQLMTVDVHGQARPLMEEQRSYGYPRFSPDGRRLAFDVQRAQGTDIWVYDLAARTLQRLTTDGINDRPEWTPDGKKVLYASNRQGGKYALWWQLADASAPAELVYAATSTMIREGIIAPDGRAVIFREDTRDNKRDVFLLPLEQNSKPVPLLNTPADELMPRLSPDGKWLAYVSDESGQYEVYVRMLSAAAGRIPVSSGGGMEPLWSPDGRTIYYRNGAKLVAASVVTSPALAVTGRRVLFDATFDADPFHPNYDVAHDGKSFVMLKTPDEGRQLVVVQNWIQELRARTERKR